MGGSSNDSRRSLYAYERTSSALGEGRETPFAMSSSCSLSAGESLTFSCARDLAQLRARCVRREWRRPSPAPKRNGAAEALEARGGESFAVR